MSNQPAVPPVLQVVVMGVSATGKSTVAGALAGELGWAFIEGDDLHPPANVAKMESGVALGDADRKPWLDAISERARERAAAGLSTVITCSALKRAYRDRLREGVPTMWFLHLDAPFEALEPRMEQRERHFMPTGLLRSQFADLEPLEADEEGIVVDVSPGIDKVTADAVAAVRGQLQT